jgi:hypothetical protein
MGMTNYDDLIGQNKLLKQEIQKLKEQLKDARNQNWHKLSEEGMPKYAGTYLVASRTGNTDKVELCMKTNGRMDWLVKPGILVDAWMEYPHYSNLTRTRLSSPTKKPDIKFDKYNIIVSEIYLIKEE